MSSMIFKSSPDLRSPLLTSPTIVNLHEAEDASITALPMTITTKHKESLWSRIVSKIKDVFGRMGKGNNGEEEMEVGGPTDFKHGRTGEMGGLRTRVSGESEWDDLEDTKGHVSK
jgi:hypothetical protein